MTARSEKPDIFTGQPKFQKLCFSICTAVGNREYGSVSVISYCWISLWPDFRIIQRQWSVLQILYSLPLPPLQTAHREFKFIKSTDVLECEVLTAVVMKISIVWGITLYSLSNQATSHRFLAAYKLTLKMEAIFSSERLIDFRRTTRCYIPEYFGCLRLFIYIGSSLYESFGSFFLSSIPICSHLPIGHLWNASFHFSFFI
jgi:hypothetical protein